MAHADDDGVVLPPRIAPTQIMILPVAPKEETRREIFEACDRLRDELREQRFGDLSLEVEVDRRDLGGGIKNWEWIKKGVPIRVEIGPRDLQTQSLVVSRRDQPVKTKQTMAIKEFVARAAALLGEIHQNLYHRAKEFRDAHTRQINSRDDFYEFFTPKSSAKPEIHGGFALAHWNGSREVEERIKEDLKVTIRVIPFGDGEGSGRCIFTGEPSRGRAIWAKSY
jgi:prolyl-tRNA synthetase